MNSKSCRIKSRKKLKHGLRRKSGRKKSKRISRRKSGRKKSKRILRRKSGRKKSKRISRKKSGRKKSKRISRRKSGRKKSKRISRRKRLYKRADGNPLSVGAIEDVTERCREKRGDDYTIKSVTALAKTLGKDTIDPTDIDSIIQSFQGKVYEGSAYKENPLINRVIFNYNMSIERKKLGRFKYLTGSANSLTEHYNPSTGVHIYVFGEFHSYILNKCHQDKDTKHETINQLDFFKRLSIDSPCIVDVFTEFRFTKGICQERILRELDENIGRGDGDFKVVHDMRHVMERCSRRRTDCVARFHSVDIRNYQFNWCRTNTDINQILRFFLLSGIELGEVVSELGSLSNETISSMLGIKDEKIWYEMSAIFAPLSDSDGVSTIAYTIYNEYLTNFDLLNKEICRSYYSDLIPMFLIIMLIEVMKANKGHLERLSAFIQNFNSEENNDYTYDVYLSVLKIGACIMDAYNISRIFKVFQPDKNGIQTIQRIPRNIVVYAGDTHSENLRQFLDIIKFKLLNKSYTDFSKLKDIEGADMAQYQCLDISKFEHPFFSNNFELRQTL